MTATFAIVLQELVKAYFGANPIPVSAPAALTGSANVGAWLGLGSGVIYPWWRLTYLGFSIAVIAAVLLFLRFTTWGMVVRAGMEDRQTVGFLGIDSQRNAAVARSDCEFPQARREFLMHALALRKLIAREQRGQLHGNAGR